MFVSNRVTKILSVIKSLRTSSIAKGGRFLRTENKGITLIELLVIITILGILVAIAVPSVLGLIDKSRDEVCRVNLLQLEKEYETYLALEIIDHSNVVFTQFLESYDGKICGDECSFAYVDGKVVCSDGAGDDDGKEDEGVPFL
ncbi:type II secretion system protein [Alkalihalobacterium alkalinitrilicum]|uniref:type II secretion system protein n=1 Tax=Alkalihalobacterium alkalinitrilicum TaxID=427920 RepID=UPI000995133D|nr:prepilin-type N-terminal cleavage/methylation domain-containing protein [Alkalihalobacterium alkalinitrilicum]